MKGFTPTEESYGFSPVPTFCGRDYGRDVVPLSPAVREANRRNEVLPRACPGGSAGITDNDWFVTKH